MGKDTQGNQDEADRLDRDYTGDSVNARTPELKKELNKQTGKLQREYEQSGTSEQDGKH